MNKHLSIILKFPQLILDYVNQYAYILSLDIKALRKKYATEDYPVEEYEEEL